MTGTDLKNARQGAKCTQAQAARRLGVTQAYLSMVESGRRPVTRSLVAQVRKVFELPPTTLPLAAEKQAACGEDELKSDLGALGYPGFGYLRGKPTRNPAQLLFCALDRADLDTRVVEALPWLACMYADLNWDWLVCNAKLHDRQNRLGFVVTLAGELAQKSGDSVRSLKLAESGTLLDRSRLVREDTLCHESMTQAERKWLRHKRSPEAKHWNLLTDLEVRNLAYVPA